MVEAARKYNRMVQVGIAEPQPSPHKIKAMELLQRGRHRQGLSWPRASATSGAAPSATRPTSPVPPGLDWDMFLGPAPMRPFNKNSLQVQLALVLGHRQRRHRQPGHPRDGHRALGPGQGRWPEAVVSTGGKYVYDDDQETPNTQIATFDYGDAEIVFEVRGILTGGDDAA